MNISTQSAMKTKIFLQMMILLQHLHPIINIRVRRPFNCSLGHLIMQWSCQLWLNHSQFLYFEWKSFNVISAYLLEIDQAQIKNSNNHALLSAWLDSIEIYCKGFFFISIWYLFTCPNQSAQRKHKTKAWDLRDVFRTLPSI